MQRFETTNEVEAQRCRRSQYHGRIATVAVAGSTVTGLVYSVAEDKISSPKKWIVTIIPKSARA